MFFKGIGALILGLYIGLNAEFSEIKPVIPEYTENVQVKEFKGKDFIKNNTIEGLYTLTSIHSVINKNSIKLPIIDVIFSIIYKDKDPEILKNIIQVQILLL